MGKLNHSIRMIVIIAIALYALADLAVIGLRSAETASAHGGGFRLTEQRTAGPYELLLGTIPDPPIVGEAIVILQITDADTGLRVPDAEVELTATGPDSQASPLGTLAFGPDSYDPTLYETRVMLDIEGRWTFSISVSADGGSGDALFNYDVKRASPVAGIITLTTLLAFLIVLGLSMRAFLKQRSGQRSGQRTNGQRARRRKA